MTIETTESSIATWVASMLISTVTLICGSLKALFGQVPSPTEAGAWSFYGVLIVAIIVLFTCILIGLRWFANHWQAKQEEMQEQANSAIREQAEATREYAASNRDLADAIKKNTEVVDRQNDFFDQVNRDIVKQRLLGPLS